MKSFLLAACLLLATAPADAASVHSPVEKVVTLLTELRDRLTTDQEAEQKAFETFACWAKTTTAELATDIETAWTELQTLRQSVLKRTATVAVLESEIAQLKKDLSDNEASVEAATSLRTQEHTEFVTETAEMKEALAALEKAVTILKAATTSSAFLQSSTAESVTKTVLEAMPTRMLAKPKLASLVKTLTVHGAGSKYAPQSMTIQGILVDMYSTFSSELEAATMAEATASNLYELLMHQKAQERAEIEESQQQKEDEKAAEESEIAAETQRHDDTEAEREDAIKFFDVAKKAAIEKNDEWTKRSGLRTEELAGITKALEILSSDAAREVFDKATRKETVTLLQLHAGSAGEPAERAYAALKAQATKMHSLTLAKVAAKVHEAKTGHFDTVIAAIDTMVSTLEEEAKDDREKRDTCVTDLKDIASTTADLQWKIEKNNAMIAELVNQGEKLTGEKTAQAEQSAAIVAQLAEMKTEREAEKAAYEQAKTDDEDAIKLLSEAEAVLAEYYENNDIDVGMNDSSTEAVSLHRQTHDMKVAGLHRQTPEDKVPDFDTSDKGSRKLETKGIFALLKTIKENLEGEITINTKEEEQAVASYAAQVEALDAMKVSHDEAVVTLTSAIAAKGEAQAEEESAMETNEAELESTGSHETSIKPNCEWLIGAFATRAKQRTAEMDGLRQAKEFLAGYMPPEEATALLGKGSHPQIRGAKA